MGGAASGTAGGGSSGCMGQNGYAGLHILRDAHSLQLVIHRIYTIVVYFIAVCIWPRRRISRQPATTDSHGLHRASSAVASSTLAAVAPTADA